MLQETRINCSDPFKQFRENQQSSVANLPLVLTPDMEVKDGHK